MLVLLLYHHSWVTEADKQYSAEVMLPSGRNHFILCRSKNSHVQIWTAYNLLHLYYIMCVLGISFLPRATRIWNLRYAMPNACRYVCKLLQTAVVISSVHYTIYGRSSYPSVDWGLRHNLRHGIKRRALIVVCGGDSELPWKRPRFLDVAVLRSVGRTRVQTCKNPSLRHRLWWHGNS